MAKILLARVNPLDATEVEYKTNKGTFIGVRTGCDTTRLHHIESDKYITLYNPIEFIKNY